MKNLLKLPLLFASLLAGSLLTSCVASAPAVVVAGPPRPYYRPARVVVRPRPVVVYPGPRYYRPHPRRPYRAVIRY